MGGGTSGLFFGTKGAKHEYQYSLFPDGIRKDGWDSSAVASNTGSQAGSTAQTQEKRQLITASMILQKIHEYHVGSIGAQDLVDWLSFVVSSPHYHMDRRLRSIVRDGIRVLSYCLRLKEDWTPAFNRKLQEIENRLHQL